ncbi:MAG: hypothetical protein AAF604_05245 [Acidobacteriota bacterium]
MVLRRSLSALLLAGLALTAEGEILGGSFPGIDFGDTEKSVRAALKSACTKLSTVAVEPPSLPIAETSESHLVCLGYQSQGVELGEVAFTFADDGLALIEARRGAIESLLPKAGEHNASLGGYDAYLSTWTVAHADEDAVWALTEAAARSYLFLWRNPDLPSNPEPRSSHRPSIAAPKILEFGADLETMTERLSAACQGISTEEIAEPWLPSKPRRQTQINCFGHRFAGYPRKIEAVFGDGRLELAWILTGKGEEDRIRQALIAAHGPAEIVSQNYEAFAGGRIALRKDKPEVLLLSEPLVPLYQATFAGDD